MAKLIDSISKSQNKKTAILPQNPERLIYPPPLASQKYRHPRRRKRARKWSFAFAVMIILVIIIYPVASLGVDLFRLSLPGRYLVAFQNNAELRGAGGFLGSFAIIELSGRKIKSYYLESNIYKKDNQFTAVNKLSFPDYLAPHFKDISLSLHDANYPADFAEAAGNLARFYELEYGDKVDGVVAVNASVVQNLIEKTGPIALAEKGMTIDSQTFFDSLAREVEQDYFASQTNKDINEPKTVLKEMLNPLLRATGKLPLPTLYRLLIEQVKQKQILFWFKDQRQKIVEKRNWGGRVSDFPGEYVFVSNNNIFGGKTSLDISQEIELAKPTFNSPERKLTITRYHTKGTNYGSGSDNRNYMKIFLPSGAVINQVTRNGDVLKEEDMEVISEAGRKAIGLFIITPVNDFTTITVDYRLGQILISKKIHYQKQPGTLPDKLTLKENNKIYFTGRLKQDKII